MNPILFYLCPSIPRFLIIGTLVFALTTGLTTKALSQINVPIKFNLVKGKSPAGRDDYYTDGKYCLAMDTPFQADRPETDQGRLTMLDGEYNLHFRETSDGLYYGTGFSRGAYRYIVIARYFSYEVFSKFNDKGFSDYSAWLLNILRDSIRKGRDLHFN
jgi:hypothetical protein